MQELSSRPRPRIISTILSEARSKKVLLMSWAIFTGLLGAPVMAQADSIYWSTDGGPTISSVDLNGSGGSDLNTGGTTVNEPGGIAIDAATGTIYWANYTNNTISYA